MNIQSMKTAFLTFTLLLGSIFGYANDNKLSNISTNVSYGRKLVIDIRAMHSDATIQLETAFGRELIDMKAKAPEFTKIFDLSELASGQYLLTIQYGIREMIQEVAVDEDDAYIKLSDREIFMMPIVRQVQTDYLDVTVFNKRIETVSVEIVNSNGRTVFEEEIRNVIKVEKRYDLGHLARDTYAVVVRTPRKTYTDFIKNW